MAREFTTTRRVQFAETDLAGIMHFANYFRIMEEVEHAYFRSFGASVAQKFEGGELGFPRVSTRCDYSSPIRFEEVLTCRLQVVKLGNKSLTHEVTFSCEEAGAPARRIAQGQTTIVCVLRRPEGFESIRIPDFIREAIEAG